MERSAPLRKLQFELDPHAYQIALRVYEAIHADQDSRDEELQRTVGKAIERQADQMRGVLRVQEKHTLAIHDHKRTSSIGSWLLKAFLAGAVSFLLFAASTIWSRSEESTTFRLEIQYQAKEIETLKAEIDRLRTTVHP